MFSTTSSLLSSDGNASPQSLFLSPFRQLLPVLRIQKDLTEYSVCRQLPWRGAVEYDSGSLPNNSMKGKFLFTPSMAFSDVFTLARFQLMHFRRTLRQEISSYIHWQPGKASYRDEIISSVKLSLLWRSAEELLVASTVDLFRKSNLAWSTFHSCSTPLELSNKRRAFQLLFLQLWFLFFKDTLYAFNLPGRDSFSLFISSNSLSSSWILVTYFTGRYKPPRTPPGDRSAVSSTSDCNGKSSLLWIIPSTVLHSDTCCTNTSVPCDQYRAYALPCIRPL